MNNEDITGKKFNKLTAIRRVYDYPVKGNYWLCKCDCGNECVVKKYYLVHLIQISCGCYIKEINREKRITHNMTNTKIYRAWNSMKGRCYNKNNRAYKNYGGRGIDVCKEWLDDFMNFYNWSMENGYSDELSIDRIDNNKGYCPENCRWATIEQQQNNRRGVHKIEYNGETHSPAEWSRIIGISETTIKNRLYKQGMSVEEALMPVDRRYSGLGKRWG